ncbi:MULTISPECIES: invasion associated locus B family protein [unclassified Rhizobium]|uniref:invasion associated locus B family protein n=1 Tax=unclassified Rhizobium TaxID=2613769 RepID=UPI000EA88FE4|nr:MULTISPECIES: invasion associated locus B family protein [unclassified Rhizobium]AYG69797.1 invasion associated locus B family protein [Rhizobium sp. CCGE531]AYG76172.1 invasion associated locus B family protein [Rhizobium sp. CCGE532]
MLKGALLGVSTFMACILLFGPFAAGQEGALPNYRIRPSEVVAPQGLKPGDYQRTIRPFENWTLICDENLKVRQKVCNVTQIIENERGQIAFSWSLAATKGGEPYMILRTAPVAKSDGRISVTFEGRNEPIQVKLDGCSQTVCVGMLPIGPMLREQISKSTAPTISYPTADGQTISVTANLKGLSIAVKAIK